MLVLDGLQTNWCHAMLLQRLAARHATGDSRRRLAVQNIRLGEHNVRDVEPLPLPPPPPSTLPHALQQACTALKEASLGRHYRSGCSPKLQPFLSKHGKTLMVRADSIPRHTTKPPHYPPPPGSRCRCSQRVSAIGSAATPPAACAHPPPARQLERCRKRWPLSIGPAGWQGQQRMLSHVRAQSGVQMLISLLHWCRTVTATALTVHGQRSLCCILLPPYRRTFGVLPQSNHFEEQVMAVQNDSCPAMGKAKLRRTDIVQGVAKPVSEPTSIHCPDIS